MPGARYLTITFWSETAFFLRSKRWASFAARFILRHFGIVKRNFFLFTCLNRIEPFFGRSKWFIFVFLKLIFHLLFYKIKTRRRALPFKSLLLSKLQNLTRLSAKYNSIEERFHSFGCKSWCQFFIFAVQRLCKVIFVWPNFSFTF